MGGRPITALSIVGFPIHTAPDDALHQILRGGIDKMTEAGVPVVGGHSINDKEIKAGFAVTGLVHPDKIVTNAGARPGDRLILTKPLGTGILAFAAQIGRAPAEGLAAAARSMAQLNRMASKLMIECGAHACTDVTGFGLMGHLGPMAAASKVDVELFWDDLPLLPGVRECLAEGIASGALERNRESFGGALTADDDVQPAMLDLCFDPQTSGGLLIAVPEARADELLGRLHAAGIVEAAMIGRVLAPGTGRVLLHTRRQGQMATAISARGTTHGRPITQETDKMSCCEGSSESGHQAVGDQADVAAIGQKFQEFLQAAGAPGALDGKTKRAIAIALSVYARCEPCVKSHMKKAREIGFSQEEIDEAAWVAISFGGSPTMVFYNGVRRA
jgi:selenide,water dikinase